MYHNSILKYCRNVTKEGIEVEESEEATESESEEEESEDEGGKSQLLCMGVWI